MPDVTICRAGRSTVLNDPPPAPHIAMRSGNGMGPLTLALHRLWRNW